MNLTQELINVLQGIHDGKPWEYKAAGGFEWKSSSIPNMIYLLTSGYEIRLKPEPDPYAEAKSAWLDGELQYLTDRDTWVNLSSHHTPSFDNPPSRYRRKPKPVRVPLGPEDVPPGSVLRGHAWTGKHCYITVSEVTPNGVHVKRLPEPLSFDSLQAGWHINRSLSLTGKWDAAAWEPCWKEVQT